MIAKPNRQKILTAAAIAIIIIAGISGYYYWPKNSSLTPKIVELEKPASLIAVNNDEIINIEENATSQMLWETISSLSRKQYPDGFTRILIKTSEFDAALNTTTIAYGNFAEVVKNSLNIYFPDYLTNAADNFTFFINTQNNNNKLGIVIKINNGAIPTNIKNILKAWEEDSMIRDLIPLVFLASNKTGGLSPDTESFNDADYRNIDMRYVNFQGPGNSIDYAFLESRNLLVITTSKDSTYNTIDNIVDGE